MKLLQKKRIFVKNVSKMSNNANNTMPSDGLYFFAVLLKYKKFVLITTLIAAITSVIISFLLPKWYASTVNFVPPVESSSKSAGGGISSMMKEFGLSQVGGTKGDDYSMLVFLDSRSVADSMIKKYDLIKKYKMEDDYYVEVLKEFRDNIKVEYMKEGNYYLTVWDKDSILAAEMANDYIEITNYFAEKTKKDESEANVEYLTNRLASIDSTINTISNEIWEISKEKSLFSPEEQGKAAATALANMKSIEYEYGIFYDYYSKMFGDDDPNAQYFNEFINSAKKKVDDAFSKPGLIGNFAINDVAPIAVDFVVKTAEIEALTKTKAFLTTSLEKSKMEYYNSNKNFFVVDKAVPTDKKDRPKRLFIVAGGTFSGFILSVLIILIFNGFRIASIQAKEIIDNQYFN